MASSLLTNPTMCHYLTETKFNAISEWIQQVEDVSEDRTSSYANSGRYLARSYLPKSGYDNACSDTEDFDQKNERQLLRVGIITHPDSDEDEDEALFTEETKELLKEILHARYQSSALIQQKDYIPKLLKRGLLTNASSMRRHITAALVPSVETLSLTLHQFKYAGDEEDEPWAHCLPIFGEIPKPAYTAGLGSRAFTVGQLEKLGRIHSAKTPVKATHKVYCPFLACELQCQEEGILLAEVRCTQAAAIAVKSIEKLYKLTFRTEELHGEILFFTLSHDAAEVSIHAYVGDVYKNDVQFQRHLVLRKDLRSGTRAASMAYSAVRIIYDLFLPIHLQRITSAVEDLVLSEVASASVSSCALSETSPPKNRVNDEGEAQAEAQAEAEEDDNSPKNHGNDEGEVEDDRDDHDDHEEVQEGAVDLQKRRQRQTAPRKRPMSSSEGSRRTRLCPGLGEA